MKSKLFYKKLLIAVLLISLGMIYFIIHFSKDSLFFAKVLPNKQLYLSTGQIFKLSEEKDKIVVFFRTDCSFCEQLINEIIHSDNITDNIEVLFISSEPPNSIYQYSLNNPSEKITFLYDRNDLLSSNLKVKNYPTVFIFKGEKKKLTRRFIGAAPLKVIINTLNRE